MTTRQSGSAARTTLRRLRWLLAVLFTTTNALGLILLAWLAVRSDAQRGAQHLDGDLQRITLAAIQRLGSSGGAVSLAGLAGSGLIEGCPNFAVLPGGASPFVGMQSNGPCVTAPLDKLNQLASRAVNSDAIVVGNGSAGHNRVRLLAEPFWLGKGVPAGAVVAAEDAGPEAARHDRMLALTVGGCAVLIVGLAVAGYLVAGRAMRPAANTLEQQELLLAESAHDLRTPVAALRALSETALQNPDQRAELLPRTVELSLRMGNLIDDLLTRARLAAGVEQLNLQWVRLDQLVADLVANTPTHGGNVTLSTVDSTVSADPTLLQRAVGNLLDNALRHGRMPGRHAVVTVSVADGRVTVADHGPGLAGPLKTTPFNQTGSRTTGLGLSIVRWIAAAHGGSLHVHNAAGGGAVFELTLRTNQR